MTTLFIDGPGRDAIPVVPGMRVAYWHETFAGQFDPVPGTVVRAGAKFVTVNFDGTGVRRITPANLTPWDYPPDA